MQHPTTSRLVALAVCLLAVATNRAEADYTFNIAGTFGADLRGTTGLAGGSFSGTYTIPNFVMDQTDQGLSFSDYRVNLFNAAGKLVYTFSYVPDPNRGISFTPTDGYYESNYTPTTSIIVFYTYPSYPFNTSDAYFLQMEFASPFFGTGSANPYSPQQSVRSEFVFRLGSTGGAVGITSAVSYVPAPPSLVLVGISGLLGLGRLGIARLGRGAATV